ncbi:MAG TPA: hypothetical protein VKB54_01470 [Solirubrobacteraceae bacterium]|jgi:hypothetical protein|nr:hypothetical protein [Solirubrobacteraceae bacterium]
MVADGRFLLRGITAGAATFIVTVLVAMAAVAVTTADAGTGWAERHTLTAVLFTGLWALAAACAGAIGAWQAAEGGAPDQAAARLAGALGPTVLIVLASLTALGGDGASPAAVVAEAVVEIAAAFAGAGALARRLEADL